MVKNVGYRPYVLCWKFHTQVVQVYLQSLRRNSLLKCAPQPKIAKKLKPTILKVQAHSRSLMLTPLKSISLVLVMISSTSVSICNCFTLNKIMFIWTRSLSNAFWQFKVYVRINVISDLFRPVEKKKQFNFKLYSSNNPFILLYYSN